MISNTDKKYIKRTTTTPYISLPVILLNASTATIKATGEVLKVPQQAKLIYLSMRNSYCLKKESPPPNNEYFESWSKIAVAMGLHVDHFKDDKGKTNPSKEFLLKVGLVVEGRVKGRSCYKEVKDFNDILPYITFDNDKSIQYKEDKEEAYKKFVEEKLIQESTPKTNAFTNKGFIPSGFEKFLPVTYPNKLYLDKQEVTLYPDTFKALKLVVMSHTRKGLLFTGKDKQKFWLDRKGLSCLECGTIKDNNGLCECLPF